MLFKSADDKSKRLKLLEELRRSALLDPRQKDWLDEELQRMKRGIEGEREVLHAIGPKASAAWNDGLSAHSRPAATSQTAA